MDALPVLLAAPAALGFAVLFNVRRRTLVPIALLAIAAKGIQTSLLLGGAAGTTAAFAGAFFVGVVAYVIGPWTGEASPVYAFAPVIPLVPGSYIFLALGSIMDVLATDAEGSTATVLFTRAGTNGLTAAAITLALAVGATSPMLLLPRMRTAED